MPRHILTATLVVVISVAGALAEKPPHSKGAQKASDKIPLPGLAVSLGMSVDEVAHQFQNMEFRHIPEKRWQKNGHSFRSYEQIVCTVVPLRDLNEQLLDARFIFEKHSLVEVALTIIDIHNAIEPLVVKLELVETAPKITPGNYRGLKGKIVMRRGRGNAEKSTWIIRRSE